MTNQSSVLNAGQAPPHVQPTPDTMVTRYLTLATRVLDVQCHTHEIAEAITDTYYYCSVTGQSPDSSRVVSVTGESSSEPPRRTTGSKSRWRQVGPLVGRGVAVVRVNDSGHHSAPVSVTQESSSEPPRHTTGSGSRLPQLG